MSALPEARPATGMPRLRRACLSDVERLHGFIAPLSPDGTLLARTRANLAAHVDDFRVAFHRGELVACGALQAVDAGLAEIRSVAVHPRFQGSGLGTRLVESLLADARRRGIPRVFCLTRRVNFFARLGFAPVPTERFPHKVWNDCRLCPRRECCDETAMERPARLANHHQPR